MGSSNHRFQLRRAIPQVRGKIKDAARARTGDAYGFDDRPRMGQKNRRLYVALIDEDAYTCEVRCFLCRFHSHLMTLGNTDTGTRVAEGCLLPLTVLQNH